MTLTHNYHPLLSFTTASLWSISEHQSKSDKNPYCAVNQDILHSKKNNKDCEQSVTHFLLQNWQWWWQTRRLFSNRLPGNAFCEWWQKQIFQLIKSFWWHSSKTYYSQWWHPTNIFLNLIGDVGGNKPAWWWHCETVRCVMPSDFVMVAASLSTTVMLSGDTWYLLTSQHAKSCWEQLSCFVMATEAFLSLVTLQHAVSYWGQVSCFVMTWWDICHAWYHCNSILLSRFVMTLWYCVRHWSC